MEHLVKGYMFFSNAITYRGIEEELLIKGQGDELEGGSRVVIHNPEIIDNKTNIPVLQGNRGNLLIHFEPADLLPVYCLFSCFKENYIADNRGKRTLKLSEEIKHCIKEHFPKADTVAIINNPVQFINDVQKSVLTDCKSELVNYFHLEGFKSDQGIAIDEEYLMYLFQDSPLEKEDGKVIYSLNTKYVYRALLCKDVYFANEQEFRFILPEINFLHAKLIPIELKEKIQLENLDEFLRVH